MNAITQNLLSFYVSSYRIIGNTAWVCHIIFFCCCWMSSVPSKNIPRLCSCLRTLVLLFRNSIHPGSGAMRAMIPNGSLRELLSRPCLVGVCLQNVIVNVMFLLLGHCPCCKFWFSDVHRFACRSHFICASLMSQPLDHNLGALLSLRAA